MLDCASHDCIHRHHSMCNRIVCYSYCLHYNDSKVFESKKDRGVRKGNCSTKV